MTETISRTESDESTQTEIYFNKMWNYHLLFSHHSTRISLEGTSSFSVPYRLAWYNLDMYCTASSYGLVDVGPVHKMNWTSDRGLVHHHHRVFNKVKYTGKLQSTTLTVHRQYITQYKYNAQYTVHYETYYREPYSQVTVHSTQYTMQSEQNSTQYTVHKYTDNR